MSENKYIIKKIGADDTADYNKVEKLFTASFRPCELRGGQEQQELLKRPEYELLGAFEEEELYAAAAVWKFHAGRAAIFRCSLLRIYPRGFLNRELNISLTM